MKTITALFCMGLASAALAQQIGSMDRTERFLFLGDSPAERGKSMGGGFKFGIMPTYSYFNGDNTVVSGPGLAVTFAPTNNGFGHTWASYHYDTLTSSGFGHAFRDLMVVNVQLSPNSFPINLTGTYTNDNLRDDARFTGFGVTASKSFGFGPDQTLELGITGTNEKISFANVGNRPIIQGNRSTSGTVWDASAGLFYEGGFGLAFDYVFKSDFEGSSRWFAQASAPLGSHLRGRFILGQYNITGVQFGWKF